MGSRVIRVHRSASLGLVALLIIVVSLIVPSASAQTVGSAVEGTGLQTLGACLSRNPHLIVAIVVDESGSLTGTDPDALRVPAIRAALGSLLSLTRRSNAAGPVQVDVQLSGFSAGFEARSPWTSLSATGLEPLLGVAEEYRTRTDGRETDYVLALEGANEALAVRASELAANGTGACKALLWFTDGVYDIDNATFGSKPYAPSAVGDEAWELGIDRLCDDGGLADQLRANGVINVAIGLNATGDRDLLTLMRAVAIGGNCGGFEAPEIMGALLGVTNVNLLTGAMLEAVTGTPGRSVGEAEVCGALPCQRTITVEIPEGVGSFYLLTSTTGAETQRWLKAPDSPTATLIEPGSGQSSLGSSQIDPLQLSATTVMIDVDLDDANPATGVWEVSFVDPTGADIGALATAEVYLFGSLSPRFAEDSVFQAGEPTTLEIAVVNAEGESVAGEIAAGTSLSISVGDPVTGKVNRVDATGPDANGLYRFEYLADSQSTAAALNVTAALSVVLDDGIALRPIVVERAIPIQVPVVVPSLITNQLQLRGIEGVQPAQGTIEVAGPERGEGQVCVRSWNSRSLPEGVPSAALVDGSNCVTVSAGATATLGFAVEPEGSGTGTASGIVEVELIASDGSEQVLRSIPTSFEMQKAIDEGRRWLVFAIMMLVGIGLPLAGFILVSRALTRLPESGTVLWAEVPAEVHHGVMTSSGASPTNLTFVHSDWNYLAGGSPRQAAVGRSSSVAVSHRPFGTSDALIRSSGEVIGSSGSRRRNGISQGVVPLQLARSWAFIIDEIELPDSSGVDQTPEESAAGATVRGRLVAFMDDRFQWLDRSRDVAAEAAAVVPERLEPFITAHVEGRLTNATDAVTSNSPVAVGAVGEDPFGQSSNSDSALPGWDDDPTDSSSGWSSF